MNSSRLSHAELDEAEELDEGDLPDLAATTRALVDVAPGRAHRRRVLRHRRAPHRGDVGGLDPDGSKVGGATVGGCA